VAQSSHYQPLPGWQARRLAYRGRRAQAVPTALTATAPSAELVIVPTPNLLLAADASATLEQ